MFGPLVTTEAHLAFSGARTNSNNTAEMTAMIEALSFIGPHGPVVRDEQSCIYYDSLHAAGVCLGTIQARKHVQLALACQRSMIFAQRKLWLTMQHVYGHSGNLGNECAPCFRCRRLDSTIRAVILSGVLSPRLGFTSACVAPLSPRFRKLLDETVKTFSVFPSCEPLLDCGDNCMLSVPLSTSDLHCSRWQSGEICQVLSTGAFTLFCHVLMVLRKI